MNKKNPSAVTTDKRIRDAGKSKNESAELQELRPGQSVELLKELHILTRDGRLNQDSRRKLKQVYHLFNFIEPLLTELSAQGGGPTLADHGAGKSYLGFILYDLYFKALGHGRIYGVETRAELVEKSRVLAQRLHFERMSFLNLSVAESADARELPDQIDVVTALHACDTATDDAIAFGLQKRPGPWFWCPVAKRRWQPACAKARPCSWRARPWRNCGVTPCTPANSAAR